MARRADGRDDLLPVKSQLCVLMEDVLPALLVQDDSASVGIDRTRQDAQTLTAPRWTDGGACDAR
jgi:hypothetical protein